MISDALAAGLFHLPRIHLGCKRFEWWGPEFEVTLGDLSSFADADQLLQRAPISPSTIFNPPLDMAFDAATTYTVPIWIEGKTIASHPEKFFAVTNGSSSKLLHNAANADLETVTAATESSWKAFQSWKRTPFAARRDLLNKFADVLERDADKLIQCMVDEISCPPFFAKLTYDKAIAKARETAALLLSVFGTVVTGFDEPAVHGFVFKEPIGPVLLISP